MTTPTTKAEAPSGFPWWPALALLALVCLAYIPAMRAGFIWDDDTHITDNPHLRTFAGLQRIWTDRRSTCQYYPMTFTGFWIQYQLWGLHPFGYHLVNIILQGLNAILLWRLLRRIGAPAPWWVGAVFAVHPVNVMSVAWATELKNVLSVFFMFGAAHFFLTTLRGFSRGLRLPPGFAWRATVSTMLYVLALASKTPTALLPIALALILWWKRRRIGWVHAAWLVLMLILGLFAGQITSDLEADMLRDIPAFSLTFYERFLVFGRAFWFYLLKIAWPTNLVFFYPRWAIDPHAPQSHLLPAGAVLSIALLWLARRRIGRAPVAALSYFALAAPGILLINLLYMTRFTWVADHWQYFGIPAILAWWIGAAARLARRGPPRIQRMVRGVGLLVLSVLSLLTWRQCALYKDIPTHYTRVLERNPSALIAWYNLGVYHMLHGQFDRAIPNFTRALELDPNSTEALNNLSLSLAQEGDIDAAMRHLERGIQRAESAGMHYNMAYLLLRQERHDEAIDHFRETIRLDPAFTDAYVKLAYLLLRDRPAEAVAFYREALRRRPDFTPWINGLAWIHATHPEPAVLDGPEAVRLAEFACRLTQNTNPAFLDTLAAAYARVGRFEDAVRINTSALRAMPANSPPEILDGMRKRIDLYANGQPYTETDMASYTTPGGTREVDIAPAVDLRHPGLE